MSTLRVLVVHNRYRSAQPSGEDRVVDHEVATLAGAGHQVSRFERRSDDIAAMPLVRKAMVPARVPFNSAVRAELGHRLRADPPDVVHIHNTFPLLSPSVVAACADVGIPAVATLHNYSLVCPTGTLYRDGRICTDCAGVAPIPAVRHGCYRGSRLATAPLAASLLLNRHRWWTGVRRFFCISRVQRSTLIEAGVPARRLAVKHNSVADPGARRLGAGEYLLYLGRLTGEKGLRTLMAAWERVSATGGLGMPLVIAGGGPLEEEVDRWARARADVRFVGLLGEAECGKYLARAAAVLAPSSWLEGFGLVAIESMAAGVPPVASAQGAFPELIDDGVTGLLHRPDDPDALARCLYRVVDPALNSAMGTAARARYERDFTPSAGLEHLVAGYEEVIARYAFGAR